MSALRFPIACSLAIVLTGSMFWFLWALIHVPLERRVLTPAAKIEFTRLRRDTEVRTAKQEKVQRAKSVQAPTIPQVSRASLGRGGTENIAAILTAPNIDSQANLSPGRLAVSVGGSDRDVIPLVRINPDYPLSAMQRSIEGWVLVQFTITPAGTVKDAKVVDAHPKGVFDDAALKAVSRWKYNPKIEEGVPVERRGIQVKLTFKLEA